MKYILVNWILLLTSVQANSLEAVEDEPSTIKILMPQARPTKNDQNLCTATNIASYGTQFIHKFVPHLQTERIRQMTLISCSGLAQTLTGKHWDCGEYASDFCENSRLIYFWGKNSGTMVLPKDVGLRIGSEYDMENLLLQVQYSYPFLNEANDSSGLELHLSSKEPKFLAGILSMSTAFQVSPNKNMLLGDMNCPIVTRFPIHPFATGVQTRYHHVNVSAYILGKDGMFQEILKTNPQHVQGFTPTEQNVTIYPRDFVVIRCFSTNFYKEPKFRGKKWNEMCNFYIMFYTESRQSQSHQLSCEGEFFHLISKYLPDDSIQSLNKSLEKPANPRKISHDISTTGKYVIIIFPALVLVALLVAAAAMASFCYDSNYTLQSNSDMERLDMDEDEFKPEAIAATMKQNF